MSDQNIPKIDNYGLQALRACSIHPQGVRYDAYPGIMSVLMVSGLVEERQVRAPGRSRPAWFLTEKGRELLSALSDPQAHEEEAIR